MVDFDCNTKMVQVQPPNFTATKRPTPSILPSPEKFAGEIWTASEQSCSAYETYLRLPELRELWSTTEFPGWENESITKPALQGLEITFRLISIVLSDARPYVNQREWTHRFESLSRDQLEIISILCEEDSTRGTAPIVDLTTSFGSSTEVWKSCTEHTVVSRGSELSLLPRLATWQKSEGLSSKILFYIESAMKRCVYTLGLGEPNLDGKPNLDYDAVCKPSELRNIAWNKIDNYENKVLFLIHQILESWIFVARQVLARIGEKINSDEYITATDHTWVLEKIWNLLQQIENLHVLMDPDDFLHLKTQLRMKATSQNDTFCFRSKGLVEITKMSKDLRHKVPGILGVEVDPMGGPRIQEAAMRAYREKREFEKVQLLQAFQGVEVAIKRFYYNYRQLLVVMLGSLEAKGTTTASFEEDDDLLVQLFMEPTYYPSLDAAKTFIGDFWENDRTVVVVKGGVPNQLRRSRSRQGV
ncbi:hypothetical protein RND81_03G167500 [Saponaria officinalis]|uniref:Uncharacterized protein n=1 Tax=Saponaria officinalis TaxID=3572 RepID=A0AAW1M839_SAPOF